MSFGAFIEMIRKEGAALNPETASFGTVKSSNPLVVEYFDLHLDKDELLVLNNQTFQVNDAVLLLPVNDKYVVLGKVGPAP